MKRLTLIIMGVLLCTPLYADMNPYIIGSGGGSGGGCEKGATIFSETFEAIADGEEWSNDGNWSEVGATSDVFVGDNAQYHGGSLSGFVDNTSGGSMIYRTFDEITSGYVAIEYWVRWEVENVTQSLNFVVSDDAITNASNQRVEFRVDVSGNLQINDNDTWVTIASIDDDTWYKVEVQINTSQANGVDAIRVWIGDGTTQTESANSPFDTRGRTNPSGIDRLGFGSDTSTDADYWIDDVLAYSGERCAE